MERLLNEAIRAALDAGADYADARIVRSNWESVRVVSMDIAGIDRGEHLGVGIRVLRRAAWGFASGTQLDLVGVRRLAQRAVELAHASALLLTPELDFLPAPAVSAEWETPVSQDPFAVSITDRAQLLMDASNYILGAPLAYAVSGHISCSREEKLFASSAGSLISQTRVITGAGFTAYGEGPGTTGQRSYPVPQGGQYQAGGFEVVEHLDLLGGAEQAREDLTYLLRSNPCVPGHRDVVMSSATVAHLLHHTADQLTGPDRERFVNATGSAATLGPPRLGSELVTLVNDPTAASGIGSYAFDDEGVEARDTTLVDAGFVGDQLFDLETVSLTGGASSSAMRAAGFPRAPIVQMANVNLRPRGTTVEEIIAETEIGILVDGPMRVTLDQGGHRCQIEAEIAWEIDGGRVRETVRQPAIVVHLPTVWQRCDAIAGLADHRIWGIPKATRGVPRQVLGVGHGTSSARFRDCEVRWARG